MNLQWVKNRWKELRWGAFNYLIPFTSFFNIVLLFSLRFNLTGDPLWYFIFFLFTGLLSASTLIGHFHGAKQQATDAHMEFDPVIPKIADEVVKRLRESEKNV